MNKTTIITLVAGLLVGHAVTYAVITNRVGNLHVPTASTTEDPMMAALEGKTGDAFDKEFIAQMVMHHEGAVDMANLALTNANHAEIKSLANAIIAAQNKEINDMKAWYKSWYGTDLPAMNAEGMMNH